MQFFFTKDERHRSFSFCFKFFHFFRSGQRYPKVFWSGGKAPFSELSGSFLAAKTSPMLQNFKTFDKNYTDRFLLMFGWDIWPLEAKIKGPPTLWSFWKNIFWTRSFTKISNFKKLFTFNCLYWGKWKKKRMVPPRIWRFRTVLLMESSPEAAEKCGVVQVNLFFVASFFFSRSFFFKILRKICCWR